MPFKSSKQKKLMEIVAHDKKFADKVNIKQSVAKKLITDDEKAKKEKKAKESKWKSSYLVCTPQFTILAW